MIDDPGAKRDRIGATFEKLETWLLSVVEPTLTAEEMQEGLPIWLTLPSFPDAITVAIPTDRRLSMIGLSGSSSQYVELRPPPRLMFTEANWCVERSA